MGKAGERLKTVNATTLEQLVIEMWAGWVRDKFGAEPDLLLAQVPETGELAVIDIMGSMTPDEVEARFRECVAYFNRSKAQQAKQQRDS